MGVLEHYNMFELLSRSPSGSARRPRQTSLEMCHSRHPLQWKGALFSQLAWRLYLVFESVRFNVNVETLI
jgi:hypothetical protein